MQIIVEKRIEMYEKLEREYRNGGCIGAVCIVMGVFLFVKFVTFSALVTCILLTVYGIRQLWKYFINSKNILAVFIANLFNLREYRLQHSYRVAHAAGEIARREGLDEEGLIIGGLLHDVLIAQDYFEKL